MTVLNVVLSAISALAAVIAAVGIFIAARQLKFSVWLKAQGIYTEPEFLVARKEILQHFGFKESVPSRIGQNDEESAIKVCQKMDELSRLRPFLGQRKIIETWGYPLGKSWMILKSTIEQEREFHPTKWEAFERIGKAAVKKYRLEKVNQEMVEKKTNFNKTF